MNAKIINIRKSEWSKGKNDRGEDWAHIDLSGEQLGVRIEELPPGSSSSEHHYHTHEEEHVLVMEGEATLFLGDDEIDLKSGDHVWFAAGDDTPHHLENRSTEKLTYLVFGERKEGDVVLYPNRNVALVKSLGNKLLPYREDSESNS